MTILTQRGSRWLKKLFYAQQDPVNLALLSDATRLLCSSSSSSSSSSSIGTGSDSTEFFDPALSFLLLQALRHNCLLLSLCNPVLGTPR